MKSFKKYTITLLALLSSWSEFGMQQGPVQFAAAVGNNIIIQELQQGMSCKTIQTLDKNANGHKGWVYSLAYDHKTGCLFSGSDDTTIKIWTTDKNNTYKCIQTLDENAGGHTDIACSLAYDNKTGYLFSGSEDKTIKIWASDENNTYKCIQTKKESGRARALVILRGDKDEQEELAQQDTKERIGFIFDDLAKPADESLLPQFNVNVRKPWDFLATKQPEVLTRQEQAARNINIDKKQEKINQKINTLTATPALLFN